MPELPEVETLVRRLRALLIGRTITEVTLHWKRTIARPAPNDFARLLHGYTVQAIDRRAKYVVFTLMYTPAEQHSLESKQARHSALRSRGGRLAPPSLFLLIHLKMSGKLNVVDRAAPLEKHDRVTFDLDHGQQLRFNDVRKFGKMWLVTDPNDVTGQHGPEPLDEAFTLKKFREMIAGRSGMIKPLLLNQHFLSGVGNIYADESLWYAKIHPQRTVDSLSGAEVAALYRSIRRVLRTAIEQQGTDAGDGVIEGDYQPRVYGRENRPCYRCHRPIHRIVVGQRGTHVCLYCQHKKRGR